MSTKTCLSTWVYNGEGQDMFLELAIACAPAEAEAQTRWNVHVCAGLSAPPPPVCFGCLCLVCMAVHA